MATLKQTITNCRSQFSLYNNNRFDKRISRSQAEFMLHVGKFDDMIIETRVPEIGLNTKETVSLRPRPVEFTII